jgi:hypothetical protein
LARPMAEMKGSEACPSCGASAARIFSAFATSVRGGARRAPSRDGAPRVVRRATEREEGRSARQKKGAPAPAARPSSHAHGPARPWMIGH